MVLSKKQFDIFRKLCSRYKIKIDSLKLSDFRRQMNPRHFRQFTLLRTDLLKINGKVILKHNIIHRNPFIIEHEKLKKKKELNKARKSTQNFFDTYINEKVSHYEESKQWDEGYLPSVPSSQTRNSPEALFEICGSESNSSLITSHDQDDSMISLGEDDESLKENQILNDNVVHKEKFMDSLLSKFGKSENKVETSSPSIKLIESISSNMDFIEDSSNVEDLSSIEIKSEFCEEGISFTKPQFPNQLSTPIVTSSRVNSAFLTADTEQEYLNSIQSAQRKRSMASNSEDDSQMKAKSVPPKLKAPERPGNMEKPRTVAEKKILMIKKINDIRYRMVEQESKIFHQTQKKTSKNEINYALLDCLLVQNTPIKKDPWRALTWLRTTEGSYIYKMLRIDGKEYKLNGSVGNHSEKYIRDQSSRPFVKYRKIKNRIGRKLMCCQPIDISPEFRENLLHNRQIRQCLRGVIDPSSDDEEEKRIKVENALAARFRKMKPGPLSSKIAQINQIEQSCQIPGAGGLMSLPMPQVNFNFTWSPGKTLDQYVKQYLRSLIPHRSLTSEWVNFALAPLKLNDKSKDEKLEKQEFNLPVPYANKKNIVVRKFKPENLTSIEIDDDIHNPSSTYRMDEKCSLDDKMEWTFDAKADLTDELECEIVDIIKDLTNSTFLNLNDGLFIKEDTVIEAPAKPEEKKQEGSLVLDPSTKRKIKCPTRMLRELRRLNGNFVTATNSASFSKDPCSNESCQKGCVCQGLNYSHTNQCEINLDKAIISNDEFENLRLHANARLAKEEKDFRPTVILTQSDTVLLQTQNKSSRAKRVPKKFTDFLDDNRAGNLIDEKSEKSEKNEKNVKKEKKDNEPKTDNPPKNEKIPRVSIFGQKIDDERELQKLGKRQINLELEIHKMLHVNVGLRHLEDLRDIEPWCMVHHLYKCMCELKSVHGDPFEYNMDMHDVVSENQQKQYLENKPHHRHNIKNKNQTIDSLNDPENLLQYSDKQPRKRDRSISPNLDFLHADSSNSSSNSSKKARILMPPIMPPAARRSLDCVSVIDTPEEPAICRRCLPVDTNFYKFKNTMPESAAGRAQGMPLENNDSRQPKFEIVNLADLINQGLGPIYINVYDAKINKLNPILRAIINNDTALVFIDGNCFFVDRQFIDVDKVSFNSLMDEIENPIFIVQKKNMSMPATKSNTVSGSFVTLIHQNKSIVQVTNKSTLKEINSVIEMILQNVKKKIEGQLHTISDHIRDQLGMITKDRTPSTSSSSSSPLNVDVVDPVQQPCPSTCGQMAEFNQIFTRRMKTFCSILKSNENKFKATPESQNKFFMSKWKVLLEAFEDNLVQVWQATILKDTGERLLLMGLTEGQEPPKIENVDPEDVINIRTLPIFDKNTSELSRMILLRMETSKTKNLVVLMYGCLNYFRICGMLNSNLNYLQDGFVARPNITTHPNLSEKIQKIHKIWCDFKEQEAKKKAESSEKLISTSEVIPSEQLEPVPSTSTNVPASNHLPKIIHVRSNAILAHSSPIRTSTPSTPFISPSRTFLSPPPPSMAEPKLVPKELPKPQKLVIKPHTIIRKLIQHKVGMQRPQIPSNTQNQTQIIKRIVPKANIIKHINIKGQKEQSKSKWCLFNITNDFSDIYIKKWKKYLSYGIIMNTILRAREKNKTVLLSPNGVSNHPLPKIYALPSAPVSFSTEYTMTNNFLIFGPYPRDAQPDLLLMQNVDGTLMLRDEYEKLKKIKRSVRTRCLWIFSDTLNEISSMMIARANEKKMKIIQAKNVVKNNNNLGLKISSCVGNYQIEDQNMVDDQSMDDFEAGNSSCSSNSSPKLIINENNLELNGHDDDSMDSSDNVKRNLQHFQNQPWSSIVYSNSSSPSTSTANDISLLHTDLEIKEEPVGEIEEDYSN